MRFPYHYLILFLVLLYLFIANHLLSINNSIGPSYRIRRESEKPAVKKPKVPKKWHILDALGLDCEAIISYPIVETELAKRLKEASFYETLQNRIINASDRCGQLHKMFNFPETPGSQEEADYPLAYGILVYKDVIQTLFMLSSFYQPQNEYCIAVGVNAERPLLDMMRNLTKCFPNVYFMERPKIEWGRYEVINSVYTCFELLSRLKSDWKYFQYLSGVDVPLKTNLEMVRIFRALNETPNFDVIPYEDWRMEYKNISESPLPLFKSSLSVLIPRQTANEMVSSPVPRKLLDFLNGSIIPDEAFWGTLLANQELFNITGSISGRKWLAHQKLVTNKDPYLLKDSPPMGYYISRYQVWNLANVLPCRGEYYSDSCVFSIADLPDLLRSKKLVGHKIHMTTYPAAFFCALKKIQDRAENPNDYQFDTSFYENLPQVQLKRGIPLENVSSEALMW